MLSFPGIKTTIWGVGWGGVACIVQSKKIVHALSIELQSEYHIAGNFLKDLFLERLFSLRMNYQDLLFFKRECTCN